MSATIQSTIDDLRETLTEYLEATYHIADPKLVGQRRRLLETAGGIYQAPYLESTPRYQTSERYEDMPDLPDAVREAFVELSDPSKGKPVIYNPPYTHQAEALQQALSHDNNLMIMTGTGSGKTESFLLPILGKLVKEAAEKPEQFAHHSAVRAIALYPMNALVNDQLGRLRLMFGDRRVVSLFEGLAGRPARFARYTSRTPYAGIRQGKKDSTKLKSIKDFFVDIEDSANHYSADPDEATADEKRAAQLLGHLGKKGKWPAKESIAEWFGKAGTQWQNKAGVFQRAVLRPHDAEMITRHEVQANPPDLLVTNYSMLEYMMMRPIERPIFDKTRAWLAACPDEKIMVVMDEAHLYRGAQGAEVGLLLRRLRERLGVGPERFQVVCATASFSAKGQETAAEFGSQLCGVPEDRFYLVKGKLALRAPSAPGTSDDLAILADLDLQKFYAEDAGEQIASVKPFLAYRNVPDAADLGVGLHAALSEYPPFNRLVNETMQRALRVSELGEVCFPHAADRAAQDRGVTALLAFGSRAKKAPEEPSLLPCRIHAFFRGLPGLWVCMDQHCTELPEAERGGPAGKLYDQPRERCRCGVPVLEYYSCRLCGTSYARAYASNVADPHLLWAEAGDRLETGAGTYDALQPLDLLLEKPASDENGRAAFYDLRTGQLDPEHECDKHRLVYVKATAAPDEDTSAAGVNKPGQFVPCGCCGRRDRFNKSSVQDHQTKGDQPFQALLSAQIKVQPPGPQPATNFAPLRGRKVLIFSDSRQVAARLAPNLQTYSLKDSIRALLPIGYRDLANVDALTKRINLEFAFPAVVLAAHRIGVRIRPELASGETMPHLADRPKGQALDPIEVLAFSQGNRCPANLMDAILRVLNDRNIGLEALAIASICEAPSTTQAIVDLPAIPGIAETAEAKLALARHWLRLWMYGGHVWFAHMPPGWWGTEVKQHSGEFQAFQRLLGDKAVRTAFKKHWFKALLTIFTEAPEQDSYRVQANKLALLIGGGWQRCSSCTSVHRPIPGTIRCFDCGSSDVAAFNPDADPVFSARRRFYRAPIAEALGQDEPVIMSLIAAEHTAQLGAAQADDAFSRAEQHEVRFQDIDLAWRGMSAPEPAIDVLSSTTTMEVGIDIGELSGVALRNMPPARANYQQRAGRAGRRGTSVATVIAFGSSDSHDEHYFTSPDEMIRGPVVDPRLTLENLEIARRHVRAYLLQRYHEERIPYFDPATPANLFSVLGSVADFRDGTGILNRIDFGNWLEENTDDLKTRISSWLPLQLSSNDRALLLSNMRDDILKAIDDAISYVGVVDDEDSDTAFAEPRFAAAPELVIGAEDPADSENEDEAQRNDDEAFDPSTDKLLDRLLSWGVLPRYAFPTDVVSFYVFNRARSTEYRPVFDYSPSQGLNVALSQYAPNKQPWIHNKQYTSKAIYSPFARDRYEAWNKKRTYFECDNCGHAKTTDHQKEKTGVKVACDACRRPEAFGLGKNWFRPSGFAHPINQDANTTADDAGETAYATRAKLIMQTPSPDTGWLPVGSRVRAYPTRETLLVSNSGPSGWGYNYCIGCGRIEPTKSPDIDLWQPHSRPALSRDGNVCNGMVSPGVVLGTDFRTDVVLFSLQVDAPFCLRPGNAETASALRTVCEAISKAGCQMLEIESSELLTEYRAALTDRGAQGFEVEIFTYDTLAGGAGFSPQLGQRSAELFERALAILEECPSDCDASCYRCLRSYKNKIEHHMLDRKLGAQFLRHALYGGHPEYADDRVAASTALLAEDIRRQLPQGHEVLLHAERAISSGLVQIPIIIRQSSNVAELWICVSSPIAPDRPCDAKLRGYVLQNLVPVSDLLVRRNLPAAIKRVFRELPAFPE
jgi:ATP-dependent helicase YprA (DUF1998 family)